MLATTALYDATSGQLLALSEASILTALRTGAASAVATDVLGADGPVTLGVVGCGTQAVTQIHALSRVRRLDRILGFDTDPDIAGSLESRIGFLGLPVDVVATDRLPELVASVDVLCTCTSVGPGEGPVIPDVAYRSWLHVNAVGADFAGKYELRASMLRCAVVCPDVVSQCLLEGESQQLTEADLGPDLARLVRDRRRFRRHAQATTVFDSTGWSLGDMVAVELVLHHAERLGIGLQAVSHDPYDPYRPPGMTSRASTDG